MHKSGRSNDVLGWWIYCFATLAFGLLAFISFGWVFGTLLTGRFGLFLIWSFAFVILGWLCTQSALQAAACDKRRGGIWIESRPPKESRWYRDDE